MKIQYSKDIGGKDLEIQVNNKNISVSLEITVIELLEHIESSKSVAVFVNGNQLLMREYDTYKLLDKDVVRIIKPLGGG